MKRAIQNPSAACAVRSIASEASALRRSADAALADKFTLAALNGGKSPFEVSSDALLRSHASTAKSLARSRSEREVKNVYSLEYLLGADGPSANAKKPKKSPFDVASAKLM